MPKENKQQPKKIEKSGYQPLKEGYQASGTNKPLSQLPQGASGESSNAASSTPNNTTSNNEDKK